MRPAERSRAAMPTGIFRLLAAMVYDTLLVLALLISTLTLLVVLTNTPVAARHVLGILLVESFGFFAYFWIFRGQTLGMLAWRLTIVSEDGYRITFTQALLRYLTAAVSLALFGVGYLAMFFDPDRRTWPDRMSDSRILYTPAK